MYTRKFYFKKSFKKEKYIVKQFTFKFKKVRDFPDGQRWPPSQKAVSVLMAEPNKCSELSQKPR